MSDEKKHAAEDSAPAIRPGVQGEAPPPTKIRIIEDAAATGDTAAAYDYWRAGSGRTQVPGTNKCCGTRQHHPFFRGPSHASAQGDDRQLRFLPEPLSLLTGQPRLLPAGPGSQ